MRIRLVVRILLTVQTLQFAYNDSSFHYQAGHFSLFTGQVFQLPDRPTPKLFSCPCGFSIFPHLSEKRQQLNVKSSISCGLRRLSWQTGTETHTHTQAQAHTQIATPTQGQKHLHRIIIQAGNRFRSLAGQMHFRRASNAPPTNPLPLLCPPPPKRKTNENVCPAHNALGFQDARTPA